MLIGEVADAVGVSSQTIRFYERKGLLPEPARGTNGYRHYDESTLARLTFIRAAQAAGLTLAEVAGVIDLRDGGTAPCAHVASLVAGRLADVRARLRELAVLEAELEEVVARTWLLDPIDCSDTEVCHILATPD